MVERIRSILKSKGPTIHAVSPDATVYEAMHMMAQKGIGAVLVIEQGNLLGSYPRRITGPESSYRARMGKMFWLRKS